MSSLGRPDHEFRVDEGVRRLGVSVGNAARNLTSNLWVKSRHENCCQDQRRRRDHLLRHRRHSLPGADQAQLPVSPQSADYDLRGEEHEDVNHRGEPGQSEDTRQLS